MDDLDVGTERLEFDLVSVLADLALLLAVPLGLLAVQILVPGSVHEAITLYPTAPTPLGRIGHAYVHFSTASLFQNLLGYGILVTLAYLVAAWMGERRWFRFSLVAILVIVPLGSGLGDQVFLAGAIEGPVAVRGFSAVVAALGGLVLVSYLGVVRRVLDPRATAVVAVAFGAGIVAMVEAIYRPNGSTATVLLTLAAVAVLLLESGSRIWNGEGGELRWRPIVGVAMLGGLVAAVLGGLIWGLFPPDPFAGEALTNVYSHALGFVLGVVIVVWGHRYWTSVDWGSTPPRSERSNS